MSEVNLEKSMMHFLTVAPIFFGVPPAVGFRFVDIILFKIKPIFF